MTSSSGSHAYHCWQPSFLPLPVCFEEKSHANKQWVCAEENRSQCLAEPRAMPTMTHCSLILITCKYIQFGWRSWMWCINNYDDCLLCVVEDVFLGAAVVNRMKTLRWWMMKNLLSCQQVRGWIMCLRWWCFNKGTLTETDNTVLKSCKLHSFASKNLHFFG